MRKPTPSQKRLLQHLTTGKGISESFHRRASAYSENFGTVSHKTLPTLVENKWITVIDEVTLPGNIVYHRLWGITHAGMQAARK